MLKQIEGSNAVAEGIALCRPEVICAYPITPQTHIVEGLSKLVKEGTLKNCEYINVESEFAALSVAIGSSAAGVRSYTATSSQGLLFMAEAVYNASGLGLPIVMTLGNRAIGSPINIWNDHSDAMSMRDAGWIMLFAETNQEAVDLHIQAFKLAEAINCPVMVCVDGFILTHAIERVDIPTQEQVDAFLPPFNPAHSLDTNAPLTMGALVGPDAYTEVKYLEHLKQLSAIKAITDLSKEFKKVFGRDAGGLIRTYKTEAAETIVIAMGSVIGTIKDVVDEEREQGNKIGVMSICSFRPFPMKEVSKALKSAKHVIVLEKAVAVGQGGFLFSHIRMAVASDVVVTTVIAGLGGRPIFKKSLRDIFVKAVGETQDGLHFLDLKKDSIKAYTSNEDKQQSDMLLGVVKPASARGR